MPQDPDSGVSVRLKGVQETTLLTLAARARDAASSKPLLNDQYSAQILSRIDANYDWKRTTGNELMPKVMVSRARLLDTWATDFLNVHRQATVLHLACGLDSRSLRLAPLWNATDKHVRWIDIDLPDVVEMRKSLELPEPEGDYELRSADVLSDDWLKAVPNDRPTLIIAEGLVMYLNPDDGLQLFQRIVQRFNGVGGQFLSDLAGSWTVGGQKSSPTMQMAEMHWAVDKPETIANSVQKNGCESFRVADFKIAEVMTEDYGAELPLSTRAILWVLSWLPWRVMSYVKFSF
jgi:O-methyltransferase involved in polyketide biosynthesis